MDDDLARVYEAHVRYELDRWRGGDALGDTVAEEVAAVFGALEVTPLRTLVPPEHAKAWIRRLVDEPLTEHLVEEIHWVVRAAHESLLEETDPLSQALPRAAFERLVAGGIGLRQLRREILAQVTGSAVYAQLISHVLYHGLKDYLLTENAVVRRLPGASSLMRMGQNAVRSASPNLEAGIDRRLLAFVASNVAETIRESRRFLEDVLDDDLVHTVADEIWAVNGPRTLGEVVAWVEADPLDELLAAALDAWPAVRSLPAVTRLLDAVVEQFYRAHGDEPTALLLADLGLTRERATAAIATVATQLLAAARDEGHLEAYVRRRLKAFYAAYSAAR